MNTKNTINKGSELFRCLMATLLILASLLILPNTYARMGEVFTQDKIQYTITSEGTLFKSVSVTGYEEGITTANIPSVVVYNDAIYTVTAIGNHAFLNCDSLISVTMENEIVSIGDNAFESCRNMFDIVISDNVTSIGSGAFGATTALTTMKLPRKLNSIGIHTFDWCTVREFVIDEDNEYFTCIDGVLFNKNQTTLVSYPHGKNINRYEIPTTVTTIGRAAFVGSSFLENIIIPNTVKRIEYAGIASCGNLRNLFVPASVVEDEGELFASCGNLESITVDENNPKYLSEDGVLFNKGKKRLICYPAKKTETSYDIPEGVLEICDWSFRYAHNLRYVNIPNSVRSIGYLAFNWCENLTSLTIPVSVVEIAGGAFSGCTGLLSMEFLGDAPTVSGEIIFEYTPVTVYYIEGTKGWTNPWYGRPTVAVSTAPTITVQPSSHTVTEGGSVQFTIGVIGTSSFNFQWYKDGKPISEAISASYRIDEVDRSDAGNYFVIVSNEYGTATSEIAVLTVNEGAAPEITVQPINKKVKVGTNTGFSVQASNATGYQWYKNGVAIEGATSRFLELNNVTKEDEGEYFAVASNKSGTAASKVVTLTVMIPPVIIKQPESLSVLEGTEAVFAVEAENATNYQWYKDNNIINGATNAIYAIDVTVKEDAGMYYVNVMHQDLVVKSKEARLEVYSLPVIIQQPESLSVSGGESATFTVKAENVTEYQWYKNGTAISGANQETYTIEVVKGYDVGEYSVVVGNTHSKLGSDVVTLSISEPYRATAEVQIANGYVIGAIVTDPGWGYEFEPKVKIKDEFGEGAEAHCIVENGMIVGIVIDNPGSGYSGESTIKVGSPFKYNSMEIAVKDVLITMHLTFGEVYQLECSKDMKTWEKVGEPFVAEDETVEIVVDVIETGRYFRVHEVK